MITFYPLITVKNLKIIPILRHCSLPLQITWIMSSSGALLRVGWFRIDVSELHIGPIFKGQDVQEQASWPLKMRPIRSPETSVRNQPMSKKTHIDPEDETDT